MTSRGLSQHLPEITALYDHVGGNPFYIDEVIDIIKDRRLIQKLAGRGYITHTRKTKYLNEANVLKQWKFTSNGVSYVNFGRD